MSLPPRPPSKFSRFERVLIVTKEARHAKYTGLSGTVYWCDSGFVRDDSNPAGHWVYVYVVYMPALDACWNFRAEHLQSLGTVDSESSHLGVEPQISFDHVVSENSGGIEGTYRLPGKFWEVVIFSKEDVTELQFSTKGKWKSGITGIYFEVPHSTKLSREYVIQAMTQAFGFKTWTEVRGPDSIVLR
jgi:hypothetical protein